MLNSDKVQTIEWSVMSCSNPFLPNKVLTDFSVDTQGWFKAAQQQQYSQHDCEIVYSRNCLSIIVRFGEKMPHDMQMNMFFYDNNIFNLIICKYYLGDFLRNRRLSIHKLTS